MAASPNARNAASILRNLQSGCYNDSDPVLLDDFEDMTPEQLRDIVKIGSGERKNCYLVDSIFEVYKTAVQRNRPVKDPMNPNYVLTRAELAQIDRIMKRRDPTYRPPAPPRLEPLPPGLRLDIRHDGRFFELRLLQHGAVVKHLGFIPSDVGVAHTGSTDLTSDVLVANIHRLWEARRFLKERQRGDAPGRIRCCKVHLYKQKEFWATDKIRKFVNMAQEVQRFLE